MSLDHTLTFRVRHYECDANGHLNHANYLRYITSIKMLQIPGVGITLNQDDH